MNSLLVVLDKQMRVLLIIGLLFISNSVFAESNFRQMNKPVFCGIQKELFAKIREAGETHFELIGINTDEETGMQIVTSIQRDPVNHTFSVVQTSSSGNSCIIAFGKFEGDHTKEGPKL
jgi:hypothetical protein